MCKTDAHVVMYLYMVWLCILQLSWLQSDSHHLLPWYQPNEAYSSRSPLMHIIGDRGLTINPGGMWKQKLKGDEVLMLFVGHYVCVQLYSMLLFCLSTCWQSKAHEKYVVLNSTSMWCSILMYIYILIIQWIILLYVQCHALIHCWVYMYCTCTVHVLH